MRFTRCFQSASMCSPTRHALYTGRHPVSTGAYPNHTFVDEGTKSIVHYLQPLGYRIAQSGKIHVNPPSVFAWERLGEGNNPDFPAVDAFLQDCVAGDDRFVLILCSNEPHTPWEKGDPSRYPPEKVILPASYVDTAETRAGMSAYLAEATYFDSQVGEAVRLLQKHGRYDETLLIVLSEQGDSLPFAKWTCYDRGLQSAMVARWPGMITPGSVNPALVEYLDLLPTFVEVAGGTSVTTLDGSSLVAVFQGRREHKEFVFGQVTSRGINNGPPWYGIRSVRSDRYKLIWNFTPEVDYQNACTKGPEFQSWVRLAEAGCADARDKVRRYTNRPEFELYDLEADPTEWHNLAGQPATAGIQEALRVRLLAWMKACGDEGQRTEMRAHDRILRPARRTED